MKLVFIHGPPASGKLTIGRELAKRTGFPLFHNHLVVDAVMAVFPFGSGGFVRLRERWWLEMFREAAEAGRSLIFTFQPEPTVASDFPARVRRTVADAGGRTVFIRLTLSPEGQDARVSTPSRSAFGKLRSVDMLRALRLGFEAAEAAMPEPELTIDTAEIDPEAAAAVIAEHIAG
ncbi:MAG TPA: shikimate kinase [Acetobacteraceae bacterium]